MTAEPTHEQEHGHGHEHGHGREKAGDPPYGYGEAADPAHGHERAADPTHGHGDGYGPEKDEKEQGDKVPRLQRGTRTAVVARGLVLLISFVCMVGFAVLLARATLVPSPGSTDLTHTNLRPGASLRAYLKQPDVRDAVKQIGGNVLLGVPFGVLLPMLMPKARGLLRVAAVTALVMLTVETVQGALVTGRAFDIDDVLLNTAGALLGYLMAGRRLGRALHPRRRHWWHRWTRRPDRPRAPGGPAAPGPPGSPPDGPPVSSDPPPVPRRP